VARASTRLGRAGNGLAPNPWFPRIPLRHLMELCPWPWRPWAFGPILGYARALDLTCALDGVDPQQDLFFPPGGFFFLRSAGRWFEGQRVEARPGPFSTPAMASLLDYRRQ